MLGKALLTAATGMMGGEGAYIEDVFSTFLYTGNGSTQTITNGIDLAGEGGLVWTKRRDSSTGSGPWINDTERGITKYVSTSSTDAEIDGGSAVISSVSSTGYSLGSFSGWNASAGTYASWTFRKAPKFFDIVTYTGTGSTRTIAHNLGSVPGAIVIKRTDTASEWVVYHRSLSFPQKLRLNTTDSAVSASSEFTNTPPTSSVFNLGTATEVNANGGTYVAYVFAHDAGGFGEDGNQNVISCGSYIGNGSTQEINLGWEPQWLLVKNSSSSTTDWILYDTMRGFQGQDTTAASDSRGLFPNLSAIEANRYRVHVTATGIKITNESNTLVNQSGQNYIYIAIRRGPMKTPTAGTDVFYAELEPQTNLRQSENVPFPPDLVNTFSRNGTDRVTTYNLFQFCDRLRGLGKPDNTFNSANDAPALISSSAAIEDSANTSFVQLKADGRNISSGGNWDSTPYGDFIYYFFRRAPGFFDVVAYTGTGSARTVAHNLGVAPELIITKPRNFTDGWGVYAAPLGATKRLRLDLVNTESTTSSYWNNTSPTSSVFTVGTDNVTNGNTYTYIAYLFATVPGVSKVGSYTGNSFTRTDIDCGFTSGARFVLIKAIDRSGGWYVWDSLRGIVSGLDPYFRLNSASAENANTDYIDPLASGFQIAPAAPAEINETGFEYVFLAIA